MNTKHANIYMAGFFDGEGYIGLSRRARKGKTYLEYNMRLSIGQKDGGVMDWVKGNFGGYLYKIKRDDSFMWIATNTTARKVLKRIEPYLIYKRPQAKLALQFFEGVREKKRISIEEKAKREDIYRLLKDSKHIFTPSASYTISVRSNND